MDLYNYIFDYIKTKYCGTDASKEWRTKDGATSAGGMLSQGGRCGRRKVRWREGTQDKMGEEEVEEGQLLDREEWIENRRTSLMFRNPFILHSFIIVV
jgi:hypothetical protein